MPVSYYEHWTVPEGIETASEFEDIIDEMLDGLDHEIEMFQSENKKLANVYWYAGQILNRLVEAEEKLDDMSKEAEDTRAELLIKDLVYEGDSIAGLLDKAITTVESLQQNAVNMVNRDIVQRIEGLQNTRKLLEKYTFEDYLDGKMLQDA